MGRSAIKVVILEIDDVIFYLLKTVIIMFFIIAIFIDYLIVTGKHHLVPIIMERIPLHILFEVIGWSLIPLVIYLSNQDISFKKIIVLLCFSLFSDWILNLLFIGGRSISPLVFFTTFLLLGFSFSLLIIVLLGDKYET